MRSKPVGMPWYREADYACLREMFEDGEKLEATYREWLKAANLSFRNLKTFGVPVEKVYVTPDEFSAWCAARGKHLNSTARMEFVNEAVAAKYLDPS